MNRQGVFVSYSHKDSAWLEELRPHLKSLARRRSLECQFWDDTLIEPGTDWQRRLDAALDSARVAILLVSKHFLSSEFILERELPRLLAAAEANQAFMVSIVLGACRIDDIAPLLKYQTVNPPSRPLEGMAKSEWEAAFVETSRVVDRILEHRDDNEDRSSQRSSSKSSAVSPSQPEVASTVQSSPTSASRVIKSDEAIERAVIARVDGWQRVSIQGNSDGGLTFQAIVEGRTIEDRVSARQVAMAGRIHDSVLKTPVQVDVRAARAFTQCLVPRDFHEVMTRGEGTVLALDSHAARIPWEMMCYGEQPASLERPIIRELLVSRFAPAASGRSRDALVIADPMCSSFPGLYGARLEGQHVSEALRSTSVITVQTSIQEEAATVLVQLLGHAWQILHFAGHAVHAAEVVTRGEAELVSGIVLGDDCYFTAADAGRLRAIPELIFLNTGVGVPTTLTQDKDAKDAEASLAVRLMVLGARAVIAPGWSPDDQSAADFAVQFYRSMLDGTPLGKAVLRARRAAFVASRQDTSWAVYQCYGDAGYTLALPPPIRPRGRSRKKRRNDTDVAQA